MLHTDAFGTESIVSFRHEYEFLSNFYEGAPLIWNGVRFPTSEHAYQWAKTLDPDEKDYILFNTSTTPGGKVIRTPTTPGQAKKRGREVSKRPDWLEICDNVMLEIIRAKFTQNWGLRQLLTKTEDLELIEGNTWHDNYWGDCQCGRLPECESTGRNMLGKLLMLLRKELNVSLYCMGCPMADDVEVPLVARKSILDGLSDAEIIYETFNRMT